MTLTQALVALELRLITRELIKQRGNMRQIALKLGINRKGLYDRMRRLGLKVENYK